MSFCLWYILSLDIHNGGDILKIGLVLGGGGSKGAYEVGVWKALRELRIDFDVVTGTSIGAMIGAMVVQGDFEKCETLWDNIVVDDVVKNGVNLEFNIKNILSQKENYTSFIESLYSHKGADITPFIKMVHRMFDEHKFFHSHINFACMTVNVTKRKPQAFKKSSFSTASEVKDALLASAACFPMFPMRNIDGEKFMDGGYHDNVPIQLARELGAEIIIAVDLKSVGKNMIDKPQSDVIYIEPYIPLGSFFHFNQEVIQRNKILGYLDTMKKFNRYYGYIYTFHFHSKRSILEYEKSFASVIKLLQHKKSYKRYKRLFEKIFYYEVNSKIATYKEYTYKYLYILEQAAFVFDMEYIHIYDFYEFKYKLQGIMKNFHSSSKMREENGSLKVIFHKLKEFSHKDIIYYIYALIKEDVCNESLKYVMSFFTEDYLKALAIYVCVMHFD